ncbi:hypothetical protein [Sorangium sp. So ce388]|uniref:hypothetical protein n=1 Tax=Sorangium sp. So ce388 TaxID=3133309 RepID=UPI003F5BF147
MKKAILFAFAPLLAACDVEPTTSAGIERRDREEATLQSAALVEPIVARGAFATEADRERFEADVLPSARAFLAYWADAGLSLPHTPARLFISPPRGTSATEALPQLYGESIFDDLRALEAEVASAPSNRAAIERLDAFTCERPPLHRGFLDEVEEHADNPDVGPADIAQALRREHEELLGPDGTFSFRTDNGEFELPLRRNCSYTLLGHSTQPTRAHPYLERDVVNHELGHALHYGLWLASGPLGERLSTAANEAIADILAHVFDGDPCHGKVLGEGGTPVDCRRRMDTYEQSVSDAFWGFGRADHETGQSLRQLIWTLREEVPADVLRVAIVDGIAAVQVALNQIDAEPLANVPTFDDEILATRYRFVREYEAASAFFHGVCARLGDAPPACGEHAQRIGDPRVAMREAWLANAPTSIGRGGVTLADGRRVTFELEGALIRQMTVTLADGEQRSYPGDPDLGLPEVEREPASGRLTLWFSEPGSTAPGAQVGWTSDGELIAR